MMRKTTIATRQTRAGAAGRPVLRQIPKWCAAGLAAAACALFAVPSAAQELLLHGPQAVAGFASAPSASGSRSLGILSYDNKNVRVVRAWYPPAAKLDPHGKMAEGMAAVVTVLAGDMKLAMGDQYDESRLRDLPVGSVFVLTHDNAAHYASTGPAGAQLMLVIAPEKDLNADLIGKQ
ncbi:hypothetical protein ACMHYJ_02545 [Castellaniella hirudinis]|uniref:hypothetical protein n=1 Tax=Castellaniella hirudinis TaxID=1144617 RepID=UPI0039C11329